MAITSQSPHRRLSAAASMGATFCTGGRMILSPRRLPGMDRWARSSLSRSLRRAPRFGFDWSDLDETDSDQIANNGSTFSTPPFNLNRTGSGFFGVVATAGETFTSVTFSQNAAGSSKRSNVTRETGPFGSATAVIPIRAGLLFAAARAIFPRLLQTSARKRT